MAGKKTLLVANIEKGKSDSNGLFLPIYGALIAKLKIHPTLQVEFIATVSSLQSKCIEYNPATTVLLFTNELVTENEVLMNIVQNFVKGGALAIFGCLFASFARPDQESKLFASMGVPWKRGAYGRATFVVSPVGRYLLNDYEERFSAKAHMLTDVLPEQKLYTLEVNTTAQRNALLSEAANASSTMAAFAKLDKGAVSYVGNHNIEDGFIRLIVSLCSVNY